MKRTHGSMKPRTFAATLTLVCMMLIVGCARETPLKVGGEAPEFSALDLNERPVKLSDFRGKVVVLRFWSSGCMACVAEMPVIDEFSKRYREKGLARVAINVGDSKEKVAHFVKSLKISYPILFDPASIAAKKYRVSAVPTTFFIDRKGIARKVVVGGMMQGRFEKTVGEML